MLQRLSGCSSWRRAPPLRQRQRSQLLRAVMLVRVAAVIAARTEQVAVMLEAVAAVAAEATSWVLLELLLQEQRQQQQSQQV